MPFLFDGFVYAGCLSRIKTRYEVKFIDGSRYSSIFEEKVQEEIRRRNSPVRGNGIFAKSKGWNYQLSLDLSRYSKSVLDSSAGTNEKSKESAIEYGRIVSDDLGLTRKAEIPTWPDQFTEVWKREYVAGFLDGDGNVDVDRRYIHVSVPQSQRTGEPAVITRHKGWFPRFCYSVHIPKRLSWRPRHRLTWNGDAGYFVLKCSEDHGIIKKDQSGAVRPILDSYFLTGKCQWGTGGPKLVSEQL